MMEMEPFTFIQEDMAATATTAAMEDLLLSWGGLYHTRGSFPDLLLSPALDPPPAPSMEDVLFWGAPPAEEPVNIPLDPPPPTTGGELLGWPAPPVIMQTAALVAPVIDQAHEALPPPPPPAPSPPRGAFVTYDRSRHCGQRGVSLRAGSGDSGNIHRSVIEFLRKIPVAEKAGKKAAEGSRCFRHMMRERERREKLSQKYADLHSMILPRPKADKNSIVRSAAAYVRELKGTRESLQRRHQELWARLADAAGERRPEAATVRLRVGNPFSPVDSMIAALRRLKSMDVRARSIRSCAGARELSAIIDVETKMVTATEVEKALQGALVEVEWKLRGGTAPAHLDPCQDATTGWWTPPPHTNMPRPPVPGAAPSLA